MDDLENRFWDKVDIRDSTDCWIWKGATNNNGYGIISVNESTELAHRISAKLSGKDISNIFVLHKCDNKRCVNPNHLYLGSHIDNMIDATANGLMRKHKFKDGEIWLMKRLYKYVTPYGINKKLSIHKIAKMFKTSSHTVNRICGGG